MGCIYNFFLTLSNYSFAMLLRLLPRLENMLLNLNDRNVEKLLVCCRNATLIPWNMPECYAISIEYVGIFRNFYGICRNITQLKYNFVKTPRKFTITKLSIRKLGSSLVLIIVTLIKIRV